MESTATGSRAARVWLWARLRASGGAGLAALALLGGCQRVQQGDTAAVAKAKSAGLSLASSRLVLPAVKGHPGAAYFTLVNTGPTEATLTGVRIPGAGMAEMHETVGKTMEPVAAVTIRPGGSVSFAPGGRHVMIFGLPANLGPGGTAQITLQFADGKTVSGPLTIDLAGADDDGTGMRM